MGNAMTCDPTDRLYLEQKPNFLQLKDSVARALTDYPTKVLARWAGATESAAERWKAGDNAPNAEKLLRLAAHIDAVWAEIRVEACRTEDDAEQVLIEFQQRLAARRINAAP